MLKNLEEVTLIIAKLFKNIHNDDNKPGTKVG